MKAAALALALAALPLAGCLAPGAPLSPAQRVPSPPAVEAPGATLEVVGDAVRVTWSGVADPLGAVPVTDPRWPVPVIVQSLAEHALTLPADVTIAEGNLTWEAGPGFLGFQLVNRTGANWCGGGLASGLAARCTGTLHAPRSGPEPWRALVLGDPTAGQLQPVRYTLAFLFRAAPLQPLGPPVREGALRFAEPVTVFNEARANEPSLAVTPQGTAYIAALGNPYGVWKSTDGLRFERLTASAIPYCAGNSLSRVPPLPLESGPSFTHIGCGDVDIATSGEDTVWFSAHWGNEAVSVSHDRGATWTTNLLAAGPDIHTDREWLATDGPMTAWHAQTSVMSAVVGAVTGLPTPSFTITKTLDGGATWLPLGRATFDRRCVSTLARDPAGTLYLGSCDRGGPGVAVSEDGGMTWEWRPGPRVERLGFLIVQATTDAANNAYLVWTAPSGPGGNNIGFAVSGDRGATWSAPRTVFSVPGTYVLPWATAGAEGRLAVAAYGTRGLAPSLEATTDWWPVVAVTQGALAPEPVWEEASVGARPNQWGPICLGGNACSSGRNLGDYFQVQADGAGSVHIAYAGADPVDGLRPGVYYARQSGGPTLGGPSVDKHGGR